ncbi:MAG: prepilin-type N-terminal cleavage/methylation domain-containing protein [Candidatus Omnitrophota bacterium]
MPNKKGYSLLEVIIAVVIVSIIAALSLTYYNNIKEATLDKQAKADLKLLRSAQMSYKMDNNNVYYPSGGSSSNLGDINNNLKVNLPTAATRAWNFRVWSSGCNRATRNGDNGRSWYLTINDADGEPDAGAGCP